MSNEKLKILEMLESGKITAQEAEQLLDALGSEPKEAGQSAQATIEPLSPPRPAGAKGKKLRVYVIGDTEKDKNMNVNVAVPMALARLVDNVIQNCIPAEALSEMKKQGVDLEAIRFSELVSTLENLDEDIVNADIKGDGADFRVRVYVE